MGDQVHRQDFDHQTAFAILAGRTVSDEAIRKFVAASRAAHDDRESLRGILSVVRDELSAREAEIAMIKEALLKAEADAERYRWLRGRPLDWSVEHHRNGWSTSYGYREMDAAIDAARAAKGGE